MKLLTVTVPCYNSQDYLHKCVESLLPGGDRMEIIIINDGSTDRTGEIADAYAQQYPNMVRVIHQENGGHGEGINQGLRHATGLYFKVVDSDDTLSEDLPAFLDALEDCARQQVDLMVTNYYYVHADGKGDRSIRYDNALPVDRVFTWDRTKSFRIHQLLTIHSCTFRTEVMRSHSKALPKHIFYEDNLMVFQVLPYVQTLFYRDSDLYRYYIGRPDQSVQQSACMRRYTHQLQVARLCFAAWDPDQEQQPKRKKYLLHELFMMFGIGILFTRLNRSQEADRNLEAMWEDCRSIRKTWADKFRYRSLLRFVCIPGSFGQRFACLVYRIAKKVVRFN